MKTDTRSVDFFLDEKGVPVALTMRDPASGKDLVYKVSEMGIPEIVELVSGGPRYMSNINNVPIKKINHAPLQPGEIVKQ